MCKLCARAGSVYLLGLRLDQVGKFTAGCEKIGRRSALICGRTFLLGRNWTRGRAAKAASHCDVLRKSWPRERSTKPPAAVILQRANESASRGDINTQRCRRLTAGGVDAQNPFRPLVLGALDLDRVDCRRRCRSWSRRRYRRRSWCRRWSWNRCRCEISNPYDKGIVMIFNTASIITLQRTAGREIARRSIASDEDITTSI